MAKIKVNANKDTQITLTSGGIENVTVVSSEGAASIAGDTLYLDFPTVAGGSIDTSTFITSASINAGSVSIADNTLMIDIPTVSGGGVNDVSIVGGNLFASIDSGKLYLLGADTTPKSGAGLTLSPNPVTLTSQGATLTANHSGDGVISAVGLPVNVTASLLNANQIELAGWNEGTAGIFLSETANYYGAAQNVQIVTSGYKTLYDMPLLTDFTNYGSATVTPAGSYSFTPQDPSYDYYGLTILGGTLQWFFSFDDFGGSLAPFILEFDVWKDTHSLILGTNNVVDLRLDIMHNYSTNTPVYFPAVQPYNQWLHFKVVSNRFFNVQCFVDDVLVAETNTLVSNPISQVKLANNTYIKNFKYQEAV